MGNHWEYEEDDGWVSRSQKKRESSALQKRGEELAALSPAVWKELPLPQELFTALLESKSIKSREALRRQMQYVGRLMREMDESEQEALVNALDALKDASRENAGLIHKIEAMRDALLADDSTALEATVMRITEEHKGMDPARLRHLAKAALADKEKKRPPKHARELFRYLRSVLEA